MSELVIDESNFDEYFFDVRKHKPVKGQVMASYTSVAELVDGDLKRDLIYLLSQTSKVEQAITLFKKIGWATYGSALQVCLEIVQDLVNGLHSDQIAEKSHKYELEAMYYTDRSLVPKDDPHWNIVEILNTNEIVEQIGEYEIRAKICCGEKDAKS